MTRRKSLKFEECHKIIDEIDHKLCTICNNWFPCNEQYFYKSKSNKIDGFHTYCKECARKMSVENKIKRYEDYQAYMKIFHAKNKKHRNATSRRWNRENKERFKEYYKGYVEENRDKINEYTRKRNSKNHKITKAEWIACKLYFNNSCAYCGLDEKLHKDLYNQDLHKEHVDDDGANDLSNCVPSCKKCNSRKWTYSLEEWYNECNENYNKERLNKINTWINDDYIKFLENPKK